MKAMIFCSIKSLRSDYNNLVFVRKKLIDAGFILFDDWMNYKVELYKDVPRFRQVKGDDYLKNSIDGIYNSNTIIFFLTCSSTYICTVLKYAIYQKKSIIVIYNSKAIINKLNLDPKSKVIYIHERSIKKFNMYFRNYEQNKTS